MRKRYRPRKAGATPGGSASAGTVDEAVVVSESELPANTARGPGKPARRRRRILPRRILPRRSRKAKASRERQILVARWMGLVLCAAGFAAIGVGWAGMAGATSADAQLPYLLSGGAVGIGLIVCGAALLVLGQVRADRLKDEARFMRMLDARSEPSGETTGAASPRTPPTQPTVTLPEITPTTATAEAMPLATAAE